MPKRVLTCNKCGERFKDQRTAEVRLLQAIFGETLCPKCYSLESATTCAHCGESVLGPVYLEGEPHHPSCLAEIVGE